LEQHAEDRLAAVPSTGALIAKGKEQLSAPLQLPGIKLN